MYVALCITVLGIRGIGVVCATCRTAAVGLDCGVWGNVASGLALETGSGVVMRVVWHGLWDMAHGAGIGAAMAGGAGGKCGVDGGGGRFATR